MSCTQSPASRRRETRIDFCAGVLLYQQQHEDIAAPKAFDVVSTRIGCPFDTATKPFHAFEQFLSRNREQVRVRIREFCKKRQELTGTSCIDREALDRMPGITVVDLEMTERAELSAEQRRFVEDTVQTLLSTPKEAERIIRDHVISTYF